MATKGKTKRDTRKVGAKVTTGRGSDGGGDTRVRFGSDEGREILRAASSEGKTVAAYLRDLGRAAAKVRIDAVDIDATELHVWPQPFSRFLVETLRIDWLTLPQMVVVRVVFDGVDPIDLETEEEREIARVITGGVDRFSEDARAGTTILRMGRDSAKTTISAAYAIYRILTVDLSGRPLGDVVFPIVAPRGRTAKIALNMVRTLVELPDLAPLVVSNTKNSVTLRRPDGREVSIEVIAKSAGGASIRGFTIPGALGDEFEFVPAGDPDAVVNDADIIGAIFPRLLLGGVLVLVSTPWPARSETARLFDENFGHPVTGIAIRAPTLLMRANDPAVAKRIERERVRDAVAAAREFDCIVAEGQGGAFFEISSIDRAFAVAPAEPQRRRASVGIDPAFVNDSSAIAVVERHGDGTNATLHCVHLEVVAPKPNAPLVPSTVIGSFAATARSFGARVWSTDTHRVGVVRSIALGVGVQTYQGPLFDQTAIYLREVLREGKLRLPHSEELRAQLRSCTYRPKSGGGLHVEAPRGPSGHADLVAALAMAVYYDRVQHAPLVKVEKAVA